MPSLNPHRPDLCEPDCPVHPNPANDTLVLDPKGDTTSWERAGEIIFELADFEDELQSWLDRSAVRQ